MGKIEYKVYQRNLGWSTVSQDAKVAGQINGPDICAISIDASEDGNPIALTYTVRQDKKGWTAITQNSLIAGEASDSAPSIDQIQISAQKSSHRVNYGVHSASLGWLPNRLPTTVLNFAFGVENAGSNNCWIDAIYIVLLPG